MGEPAIEAPDFTVERTMKLNARAWLALAILPIAMGLLIFAPAGTIHYWQGWVYLSIFMGASVLTTLDLMRRDPASQLRSSPCC